MTNEELLELFKNECCLHGNSIDKEQELDWHSLSIGFFLAKEPTLIDDVARLYSLAAEARYTFHYWN